MTAIDYMKVLDIAAFTLETASHIEVKALDLTLFNASLTRENGSVIEIFLKVNEYNLELSLNKDSIEMKEFQKWLSKFEFQLEQNFFKNISIEQSESKNEYKITVKY